MGSARSGRGESGSAGRTGGQGKGDVVSRFPVDSLVNRRGGEVILVVISAVLGFGYGTAFGELTLLPDIGIVGLRNKTHSTDRTFRLEVFFDLLGAAQCKERQQKGTSE